MEENADLRNLGFFTSFRMTVMGIPVILRATLEESHGRKSGLTYEGILHFVQYDRYGQYRKDL
ncbi:MAG: hypothetical protein J6A63_10245 [Clostridia bacterium]|nr:hypothetical protein [Clostridia bacterium]